MKGMRVMDGFNFESGKFPMSNVNKQFDPIWLTVENDLNEDGVVYLSKGARDSLELSSGDSVLIKGKDNKEAVSIPHVDDAIIVFNEIRMDSSIRDYLHVSLGDKVLVAPVKYNKYGKIIHVLNEDAIIAKSDAVDGLVKDQPHLQLAGSSGDTSDMVKNVDEKKLVLFDSVVVPVPDTALDDIVEVQSQHEKEDSPMKPKFEEKRFCAFI